MNDKKLKSTNIHSDLRSTLNGCIERDIQEIRQRNNNVENSQEEIKYLLSTLPFIKRQMNETKKTDTTTHLHPFEDHEDNTKTDGINNFVIRKKVSNNGKIYRDFMKKVHKTHIEDHTSSTERTLTCSFCNVDLVLDNKQALAICRECGVSISYNDHNDMRNLSDIDKSNLTYYTPYKRINHFKEWLTQIQAKESTVIPNEILVNIRSELKKERIFDPEHVTRERIKRYLKKIKASRYYEHIPMIISKISNQEPPSISYDTEQKLVEMFKQIQEPFDKNIPKGRKNFLSYSYTLHKFCQLIDRYDLLILFPLLKSRDKLLQQDKLWKSICSELNWTFVPSL